MSARGPSFTAYARAIERALSQYRGAPVVVSERDFALLRTWHERGIPLAVVLEALRGAQVRGKAPRSLAFVAGRVEEAWRVLAEGRAGDGAGVGARPSGDAIPRAWRARRDALDARSPLHAVLDRAIAMAERGEDPATIDAAVDAALIAEAPEDARARCLGAAESALAAHRGRMPTEVYAKTLRRAVADRLRATFGIARLVTGT